jgi:hypothetical protein
MSRIVLSFVVSISLVATGCSAQWISVALADLPVLTQMALNLAALMSTLQTGKQISPAEALAMQNISAEASKDLTFLQSLYSQYKANPSTDTLQKIENLIQDTSQSLPALLQAAHISNPALSGRITAAVNLILTTVNSFAALIPKAASSSASSVVTASRVANPKKSQQECGSSSGQGFEEAVEPAGVCSHWGCGAGCCACGTHVA